MVHGKDFHVGYSPERINPGDKVNRLETIVKIVSSTDDDITDEIAKVYEVVIEAGTHKVPSIKVAEAAKVVENSQRDINIAFMNELALAFDKMNIDSKDVIDAMNTKWNALGFSPGLVGGHCIGVDPYYFIYEAEVLGYYSQIITAGRKINDGMGEYVADKIIKKLVKTGKNPSQSNITILGLTFKDNTPDTRNSKVEDIINRLRDYNIEPLIVDPWANPQDAKDEYNVDLTDIDNVKDFNCLVFAVDHKEFANYSIEDIEKLFKSDLDNKEKIIIDIKSILNKEEIVEQGYTYWRL